MKLVTIVIPCFNSEEFIGSAIRSAIAQTYRNIEIIVVDDGSKDNTAAIARHILGSEFRGAWRLIEFQVNRGVNAARNAGWRAAQGSWIQFLDSDDFLAPTKIETQIRACVDAPSDLGAVYSPLQAVYVEDGKIEAVGSISVPDVEGRPPLTFVCAGSYLMHQTCLIKRSALDEVSGFDETLRIYEEVELLVRIANRGYRFALVPSEKPVYFWRKYRNQAREGGAEARYRITESALSWIKVVQRATESKPVSTVGLPPRHRKGFDGMATYYARQLYVHDSNAFRSYMAQLRFVNPKFRPCYPWYVSLLSRFIGYENSEAVAQSKRNLQNFLFSRGREARP